MKRKAALFWVIIGAMLLLAALFLVLYNLHEDSEAGSAAASILAELKASIPEPPEQEPDTEPETSEDLFNRYETETVPEETYIEVEGQQYLGIISIPALGIELPVMREWSYPNLKTAPCRYQGTVYAGDLIIAAHNYRSHFGPIHRLNSGDRIIFTDAEGYAHEYMVIQTEMIGGQDIATMEFGSADDWDLTLFTCTIGGQSRVTVRAVAVTEEEE